MTKTESKKQCQIRFYPDEFERIQLKAKEDGLNYQQLGELLFGAYLKSNKEVMRLVKRFVMSKKDKTPSRFDDMERNDLFRLLENNSPITKLEKSGRSPNGKK